MAAAQKSTGLQIALGIFVALFLIVAIIAGMQVGDLREAQSAAAAATASSQEATNALSKLSEEVEALKKDLGYEGAKDVGLGDPAPEGTVRGMLAKDLVMLGPTPSQPNLAAALQTMNTLLATANADLATGKNALNDTNLRLQQAEAAYREASQQLQRSADMSETGKQQLIASVGEQLKKKDDELTAAQESIRQLTNEKANISDELNKVRQQKDEEIALLTQIVDDQRLKIDEIEKPSFEIPDGEIVRVDNTPPGTVWINQGRIAGLKKGITFSVYTQSHQGVGRKLDDIKAKIEVNEILGPNLASARILDQRNDRPIHAGDPIYTPLWSAGLKEQFSFVGTIDLDGDGQSDRELLHDILSQNDASIEVEVDDKGELNREDARLTVNTKFLVIGEIPDPTKFAGFEKEQAFAVKVGQQRQDLVSQAQKQGIRVLNLRDFLAYIGYKPQQRVWQPGQNNLVPNKRSSPNAQ